MATNVNRPDQTSSPILGNQLDLLDQSTYHLRLFITSMDSIRTGNVLNRANQVTIAESGVTGISIDDLVMTSVPGVTKSNSTGESTTLNFKLTEPHGCQMLDKLYYSAVSLGIENYLKAPYFIELSFKGRSVSDSIPAALKAKWVWQITITKVDIVVTSAGTVYEVTGAFYNDLSYTNQHGDMQQGVSVVGRTFSEMMSGLESSLNSRQPQRASNKQLRPDKYEIVISDPRLVNAPLKISNADATPSRMTSTKVDDNGVTTMQFFDNTSVQYIIETVANSTEVIEKAITGNDVPKPSDNPDTKRSMFKQLYRVISEVSPLDYDSGRGDYARHFRFTVVPYNTATIIASKDEAKVDSTTSEYRMNQFLDNKSLRKQYNYIFTGLNDQVLDFNLKFNYMWYATLPRQTGTIDSYTSNDYGRRISATTNDSKMRSKVSSDNAVKSKYNSTATKGTDTPTPSSSTTSTSDADLQSKSKQSRIQGKSASTSAGSQLAFNFLEDATKDSLSRLPISAMETADGAGDDVGIEDNYHSGKSFISALFSQLQYDANSDLLVINLTIKGDPYWLDSPTTDQLNSVQSSLSSPNLDYVNSRNGQVFFLFTSQTPNIAYLDGTNASQAFKQNTVINGVYQAVVIKHQFIGGKFTQEIQATRDTITDVNLIDVNNIIKQKSQPPKQS